MWYLMESNFNFGPLRALTLEGINLVLLRPWVSYVRTSWYKGAILTHESLSVFLGHYVICSSHTLPQSHVL
jgi:hypothetical protein